MTARTNARRPNRELGIFALLRAEHYRIIHLMERISATEAEAERQVLFGELHQALLPHLRAEEEALYPRLQHTPATRSAGLEGEQEHRIINLLLSELQHMATHGDTWMAKFKVFEANMYHHIDQEEGSMFADAAAVLSPEETQDIAKTYRTVRDANLRELRALTRKKPTKEK